MSGSGLTGGSVADQILAALAAQGTTCAFLVPGYLTGPYNAALAAGRLMPVVCAHELGAGYMADGYARASGRPGCAIGISAPGAINMLTAAASAAADRVPVLFLSGNVASAGARCGAFQDGGDCGTRDRHLFGELMRCARESRQVDDVPRDLAAALAALTGTPAAPAFLSAPRDVLAAACGSEWLPAQSSIARRENSADSWSEPFRRLGNSASRIALLVGEAATDPALAPLLRAAVERHALPLATTMTAKGILPEDHPLCLGCFGYGGSPRAHAALLGGQLDGLLVMGADFTERNTLRWHAEILRERPGFHLVSWAGAPGFAALPQVVADFAATLRWLAESEDAALRPLAAGAGARRAWLDDLRRVPEVARWLPAADGLHPGEIVEVMRSVLPESTILFVDAGMGRRVVGQYWRCQAPGRLFASPVTGPMGWGLVASIGGKLARPGLPVVALAGDGSMLMHGMELATAVRHRVAVIWVINDNRALGTIQLRADSPAEAALSAGRPLCWAAFARLMGADGYVAKTASDLADALRAALAADGPALIAVRGTLAFAADDPFFGGSMRP